MEIVADVRETSTEPRVASLPMSHLSVELGHLYFEDFAAGEEALGAMFAMMKPWADAATTRVAAGEPSGRSRISTCFLVDDYFSSMASPAEIVPMVLAAAAKADLTIDYLARESACAVTGERRPAELVLGRLVSEPTPGTTGGRPPVLESGWLANGERSPSPRAEAMSAPVAWSPPRQNSARRHSIFVDVQLWDDKDGDRTWSCPMLAAVWQLLRLGLVRDQGEPVVDPVDAPAAWPAAWTDLPAVTRLTPAAAPFTAYRTISLLSRRFLPVETAVHTILSQYAADTALVRHVTERAAREDVRLPPEIVDRTEYVFGPPGVADPP